MSYDLRLEKICTHLVVDEVLALDADHVTLRTLRPIANNQVEVQINGYLIEDPSVDAYGFVLVRDSASVDKTARLIRFRKPRRATDDTYEVSYYTRAQECRRCHGLRVEHDYQYASGGSLTTLADEPKLVQDIKKLIITAIGSNRFHTWYGTSVSTLIGSKVSNSSFIRARISSDVRSAISAYMDVQAKQSRIPGQKVTAQERFVRILSLDVQQDPVEPTAFSLVLAFSNQARGALTTDLVLRLPAPESLVYRTAEQDVLAGNYGRA